MSMLGEFSKGEGTGGGRLFSGAAVPLNGGGRVSGYDGSGSLLSPQTERPTGLQKADAGGKRLFRGCRFCWQIGAA